MKRIVPKTWLSLIVISALLLSFAFHVIWFEHDHPKFMGEGWEAVVHGQDKKWLLLFSLILVVFWGSGVRNILSILRNFSRRFSEAFRNAVYYAKLSDSLVAGLRKGIIHPQLYEGVLY